MKIKMRAGAWLTIIALGCVAIFAVAVMIYGIATGFGFADFFERAVGDAYDTPYTYSEETNSLRNIEVDWVSGPVTMEFYDGDTIQITETARHQLDDNEKLLLEVSGGTLAIHWDSSWLDLSIMQDDSKSLEILIPQQFTDTLESVSIETASGDITLQDLSATEMSFETVSGMIDVRNISAEVLLIESTSGEIIGSSLKGTERFKAGSVSGNMELIGITAGEMKLDTTSGVITAEAKADTVIGDSVSGNLSLVMQNQPEKLTMESVSGSLDVTLPESKGGFLCTFSSVSGDFNCNFDTQKSGDLYMYGEGSAEVKLSTTSGNAELNKAS